MSVLASNGCMLFLFWHDDLNVVHVHVNVALLAYSTHVLVKVQIQYLAEIRTGPQQNKVLAEHDET